MMAKVKFLPRFIYDHFYKLLFLVAFAYMVFLAMSYSLCWQDFDVPHKFHPMALRNGPELRWEDFTRIFNASREGYKIGPPTRLRYFQDLVSLIDIKFRIWLFNYIPPHPSISLMWLFVMFLSPMMMFKLARQLTQRQSTAWIATILFMLSTGNLFGINKMANPAKPLANFFGLWVFYLGAVIERRIRNDSCFSPRSRRLFVIMLLILLIAFFTDETTWMFYFMIPVLFPAIFFTRRTRKFSIGGYLALIVAAGLLVFVIFPYLLNRYTPGKIIVDYIYDHTQGEDAGPLVPDFFGLRYVILTVRNLLWTQLVPWGWFWRGIILLSLLFGYLVFQFRNLTSLRRRVVLRFLGIFIIFVSLQSFAIAKVYWNHGYVLKYSLYYGALLAIILPIPLAVLLSRNPDRFRGAINKILLLVLLVVMVYNFTRVNEDIRFLQALWENAGEMDYATSRAIWKARKNPEAIRRYKYQYPIWSAWAYIQEIEIIAEQQAAKSRAELDSRRE